MARIACHKAVTMAAVALLCFASGCAALAEGEIARIQAAHGVSIDVTVAAGANDLLGGNSLVLLWNVEKELEVFPQRFKQGMQIHIAGNLDLLAESHTLEEALSAPMTIAAVQQYAGKTQGDIYVLNKGLLGSYMEIFQPGTTMWEDPHLRHEIMHAYEVNPLTRTLFTAKYQKVLDEPVGKYDPMTYKLACIDSVSLLAGEDEMTSQDTRPYIEFAARWMAAAFGDVDKNGQVDEADRQLISSAPGKFDADGDGKVTYDDPAALGGPKYSFRSGIDPATQIEMTAGVLGYRPKGFASPYGRTSPWEDKAEVLSYAVRGGFLPALYINTDPHKTARAWDRLAKIKKRDAVFGRKIEILAVLMASLESPEKLNARFEKAYAEQITR